MNYKNRNQILRNIFDSLFLLFYYPNARQQKNKLQTKGSLRNHLENYFKSQNSATVILIFDLYLVFNNCFVNYYCIEISRLFSTPRVSFDCYFV